MPQLRSTPTLRVLALVSGSGSNLQALLEAAAAPDWRTEIVAVGADRSTAGGLTIAERHGVPQFVESVRDHPTRQDWDAALAARIAAYEPDLVVSAGFMKILGPAVLQGVPVINTHPALLPAFPGAHAVRDALAYGVQVTGCTVHFVDDGVDSGPIIAQRAISVAATDTVDSLHERIKEVERPLLVDVVSQLANHGFSISERKVTIP